MACACSAAEAKAAQRIARWSVKTPPTCAAALARGASVREAASTSTRTSVASAAVYVAVAQSMRRVPRLARAWRRSAGLPLDRSRLSTSSSRDRASSSSSSSSSSAEDSLASSASSASSPSSPESAGGPRSNGAALPRGTGDPPTGDPTKDSRSGGPGRRRLSGRMLRTPISGVSGIGGTISVKRGADLGESRRIELSAPRAAVSDE
mmetsp:Transcript_27999/g.94308  ORF Transcript_27999/g.94308 Transcript_27999/m.94308 type:complete len:207 (-) Transcript_27999:375-995(-)